jgi:hypothetical protein
MVMPQNYCRMVVGAIHWSPAYSPGRRIKLPWNIPSKVHADAQQQYLKSEMDGKGTVIYQSSSKDGEISPMEMPPSVYQTHSEISGNQRSEVCGGQIPAEVAGCDVAEMD